MSSITIFPEECWSIAEWYFLWQAAGFVHGRWWRGSTEEPQPSPGRSGCRLLELKGSFIYFIHLQPPTIIILQSSFLSSAGSGTLNTDAVLVRISVVRRQILDPDCIFVQSDVMHHRISPPPLWCRVAASVLICGAQWWRHHLPVFHPGSGGGGGGDTHAVVTHIIISSYPLQMSVQCLLSPRTR